MIKIAGKVCFGKNVKWGIYIKKQFSKIVVFLAALFLGIPEVKAQQNVLPDPFILRGSAYKRSSECYQLTELRGFQTASLWYNNKINLSTDFNFEFDLNFGDRDANGADGIVFVLQNQGLNSGQPGAGIGYQGITPSVAVEFDTWQNEFDPTFDHIALQKNGNHNHSISVASGPVPASANGNNIEDGQFHRIQITWTAATKNLKVFFDKDLRINYTEDFINTVFTGTSSVYWGFTAATGGSFNNQSVCFVKKEFTELLKADVAPVNILCNGAKTGILTVVPKGGVGPYQYSINNGQTFQTTSIFTNLAAANYSVRVKDSKNDISPAELLAITEPTALTFASSQTNVSCFNVAANNLQLTAIGGVGPYQYSVNGGATFQLSGLFNNLKAGNYQVQVKDANNCLSSSLVTIKAKPELTTGLILSQPAICRGQSIKITRMGSSLPGLTFRWSPEIGLDKNNTESIIATPAATTIYTLTTSSADGCTETDEITVIVKPEPVANAGPDKVFCSGESVSLGSAALAGYSYSWSPAAGLSSGNISNPVFTAINTSAKPDTLLFTLTVTDNGCNKTDQVRVIVLPKPVNLKINGSTSVCPGVMGVAYAVTNTSSSSFRWEIFGGTIVSGQGTPAVTVNWGASSATASLKATGTTLNGCTLEPLVLPVRINPLIITPKPIGPVILCTAEAKSVTYETQNSPGSFYTWTVIGGTIVTPGNTHKVTIDWDADKPGKLVVTESSTTNLALCFGTSDTLHVQFTPSPDPALLINGPASVCAFTNKLIYSFNGLLGSTYKWTLNGVVLPVMDNLVTINVAAAGNYMLALTETSKEGCVGRQIEKQIKVNPLPVAANIVGPATVCPENLSGLQYTLPGLPNSTYTWAVTGGIIRSGNGTGTIIVDFDKSVDKKITVQETTVFNCVGPLVTVPVMYDNALLTLSLATTQETGADNIDLHFIIEDNDRINQKMNILRKGSTPGEAFSKIGETSKTSISFTDGTAQPNKQAYFYRLETTNNCGTVLNSSIHKTVFLNAVANEAKETVSLSWNTYKGWPVGSYEIYRKLEKQPAFKLYKTVSSSDSTAIFTTADEAFQQLFRIKAINRTNPNLYSWSNEAGAVFENKLAFFNIFTPNGDGQNDVFFIDNIWLYPENELVIFNRLGKEIFRQNGYNNTWSGKNVMNGTYYYVLQLAQGPAYKGWVEVVK